MGMPGMPPGMGMPGMPPGMGMPGMPPGMGMPGMPLGMGMPGMPMTPGWPICMPGNMTNSQGGLPAPGSRKAQTYMETKQKQMKQRRCAAQQNMRGYRKVKLAVEFSTANFKLAVQYGMDHMQRVKQEVANVQQMLAMTTPVKNVSSSIVPTSGVRKALLIGINYTGTENELRGCINDVHHMRDLLIRCGFQEGNIVCLTDDQPGRMPTRDNILERCMWLVAGAKPGDVLFFHYSGHGSQQEDLTGDEQTWESVCCEG